MKIFIEDDLKEVETKLRNKVRYLSEGKEEGKEKLKEVRKLQQPPGMKVTVDSRGRENCKRREL